MTDATFSEALQHYHAGRLDAATALLDDLLRREQGNAQAWQLRGAIAVDRGEPLAAIDFLRRAIVADPGYAEAHMNLGNALADAGRAGEALTALRSAIRLKPDLAMAHNSLGLVFHRQRQWLPAAGAFERALAIDANYAEAWTNLGNALSRLGEHAKAIEAHKQALRLKPDFVAAAVNLGATFRAAGRLSQAVECYRAALTHWPDSADLHLHLGAALRDDDRRAEALEAFQRALALTPEDGGALYNIGTLLAELDRPAEARAMFERSLAIHLTPAAHFGLGNLQRDAGELPAALASFRAAVALDPGFGDAWSNLLFALNFAAGESDESLTRANLDWARTLPAAAPSEPFANSRDPERVLRLAYLSSEFRRHHFLSEFLPVLRAHDRGRFRIVCYADVAQPDQHTEEIASLADEFRNLHGLTRAARASRIRADAVDILIGLTGYLANDRQLLAWRLAPLQATYINHLTTTGLASIDYRIGDPWLDPPGREIAGDPERPLRLGGFSIYEPPDDAPDPGPAPCEANGFVTFGSFNNLAKITDATLGLWAELLHRLPGSRLLIKARDLSRPWVVSQLERRATAAGFDLVRCRLVGHIADRQANLAAYCEADIGLDPIPFTGGATTREMLWLGLPVVTLSGPTRASRLGASLLARAGLPELVATSAEGYLDIAAALAVAPRRIADLRSSMRRRLRSSPLTDAIQHTRELETALRQIWRDWCVNSRS